MRIRRIITLMLVVVLLVPVSAFAGKSKWTSWWKPAEWYSKVSKKQRSTTVSGVVDSVNDEKILFKTLDGQMMQLTGKKAVTVGKERGSKIRIFGNVQKPSQQYPTGAIQVRNFRVLEELTPIDKQEEEPAPVLENEPEPYLEPEPIPEPEPYAEPSPMAIPADEPPVIATPEPVVEAVEPELDYTDYVVESGDTLGKISKKMYGTTANWKKIAQFNSITDPRLLKVGKTIRIPK